MTNQRFTVTYPGLFGEVSRSFASQARAIQWVCQVGVEKTATIAPAGERFGPTPTQAMGGYSGPGGPSSEMGDAYTKPDSEQEGS